MAWFSVFSFLFLWLSTKGSTFNLTIKQNKTQNTKCSVPFGYFQMTNLFPLILLSFVFFFFMRWQIKTNEWQINKLSKLIILKVYPSIHNWYANAHSSWLQMIIKIVFFLPLLLSLIGNNRFLLYYEFIYFFCVVVVVAVIIRSSNENQEKLLWNLYLERIALDKML